MINICIGLINLILHINHFSHLLKAIFSSIFISYGFLEATGSIDLKCWDILAWYSLDIPVYLNGLVAENLLVEPCSVVAGL
jgi:hypothetical protein